VLERIQPTIDKIVPIEQAGFRDTRSSIEHIMALTTFEMGYQKKLKTSVTFVDLST